MSVLSSDNQEKDGAAVSRLTDYFELDPCRVARSGLLKPSLDFKPLQVGIPAVWGESSQGLVNP